MSLCPQCRAILDDQSVFCKNCGYHLPQPVGSSSPTGEEKGSSSVGEDLAGTCSACGFKNLPGETFCERCGVQLAPVQSLPPIAPRLIPGSQITKPPIAVFPSGTSQEVYQTQPGKPVIQGQNFTIPIPAGRVEILIGRVDQDQAIYPDIDLAPFGGEMAGVSRQHARLIIQGKQFFLEDLYSTNFTFLNHQKLKPGIQFPLKSGDKVEFGKMQVEFWG